MIQPDSYFYTILFLDDYIPARNSRSSIADSSKRIEAPILKTFDITKDTITESIKWIDENTLYVRHNLQLPITLEMWNNEGKPIFYCPILKEGIDSISVGQVVIESSRSLSLHFNDDVHPPAEGETYKLSLKTLPSFDTTSERLAKDTETVKRALDETINIQKYGLAIIFRRNNLDALFELECEFDESYIHSLASSSDLMYLTRLSQYKTVKWLTKYTNNLQSVLEEINTTAYEIKFSWKENGTQWWKTAEDPYGYQFQKGHLNNEFPPYLN